MAKDWSQDELIKQLEKDIEKLQKKLIKLQYKLIVQKAEIKNLNDELLETIRNKRKKESRNVLSKICE